jgi:hypothetical protein
VRKGVVLMGTIMGVCAAALPPCGSEEKKPVPIYTNEDLERVRPFRDQTGVANTPAAASTSSEGSGGAGRRRTSGRSRDGEGKVRGEEYWRSQADRLRTRLQPARDRADDLRLQIEERQRQPGVRPYSDPKIVADQRKLEILERRIREAESNFEDRARRAGALPGWLR